MKPEWRAAARAGAVETLERLLSAGHDIDAKDEHGQTALMLAARDGRTVVAQFLVGRGADLNHTAKFHLTALPSSTAGWQSCARWSTPART